MTKECEGMLPRMEHEIECADRRKTMKEFVCLKIKPIVKQQNYYWLVLFLFFSAVIGGNFLGGRVNAKQDEQIKAQKDRTTSIEKNFAQHHTELMKRIETLETAQDTKFNSILKAIEKIEK